MRKILTYNVMKLIKMALSEDIGNGDITSLPLGDAMGDGKYAFIAREPFLLAGTDVVRAVFHEIDPDVKISFKNRDGDRVENGMRFGLLEGSVSSILMGERIALNFMQRLSGIATGTSRVVEALLAARAGTDSHARIMDTRKTTPGWRTLEKYAVRVGGGVNDRFGLYDAVVIKENHVAAAGGIGNAVALIRPKIPISSRIEVEARDLKAVQAALDAGADIIMLDGMDMQSVAQACKMIKGRAKAELAGLTPETMKRYAKLPVDYISIGALTQNVRCVEVSLIML